MMAHVQLGRGRYCRIIRNAPRDTLRLYVIGKTVDVEGRSQPNGLKEKSTSARSREPATSA